MQCIEHRDPTECVGEVTERRSISGATTSWRCAKGYEEYYQRVQPQIEAINRRYPDSSTPPSWFDPTYAGERWDDDY